MAKLSRELMASVTSLFEVVQQATAVGAADQMLRAIAAAAAMVAEQVKTVTQSLVLGLVGTRVTRVTRNLNLAQMMLKRRTRTIINRAALPRSIQKGV